MLSVLVIIWLLLWTHYVPTNEHKRTTSIIRKDLIASNVEPSDYSPIFTSRCSDIYENVVTRSVGLIFYNIYVGTPFISVCYCVVFISDTDFGN